MAKTGRPKKEIDQKTFEGLCAIQCNESEMCAFFGVADKTLSAWCKRTYGKSFYEIFSEKRSKGKISLRRNQWRLAETNPTMAIFLGKQYLGQTDQKDISLSGKAGGPVEINLSSMSNEELEELINNGRD